MTKTASENLKSLMIKVNNLVRERLAVSSRSMWKYYGKGEGSTINKHEIPFLLELDYLINGTGRIESFEKIERNQFIDQLILYPYEGNEFGEYNHNEDYYDETNNRIIKERLIRFIEGFPMMSFCYLDELTKPIRDVLLYVTKDAFGELD